MVHRNIHDETLEEALRHENGLTVLGFKFEVDRLHTCWLDNILSSQICIKVINDGQKYHPSLDTLSTMTKKLTAPGSQFDNEDFVTEFHDKMSDLNVVNFLPVLMDEYFHYHGSLTTGGCEEAVNWVVFKTPLAIKAKAMVKTQTQLFI